MSKVFSGYIYSTVRQRFPFLSPFKEKNTEWAYF